MTKAKPINPDSIRSFNLMRSTQSSYLFNVVALDKQGKVLAVPAVDKDYDSAVEFVNALNKTI
jgi:hypothetical protein